MHDKESLVPKILDGLREGLPEYQACQRAGVAWQTFWEWKRDVPGLDERVEASKQSRVGLLEDALYKAALKGSVTACLTLLRKESKKWRELVDGHILPASSTANAVTVGAMAGAAAVIAMMPPEKREKLRIAMRNQGMILLQPPTSNGNGAHKNGNGTHD